MRYDDLRDDKPVRTEYQGAPILLIRRRQQVYALGENCSHLGGPLSEDTLDGEIIQCPWHGSRFSIRDGHVVDGLAYTVSLAWRLAFGTDRLK